MKRGNTGWLSAVQSVSISAGIINFDSSKHPVMRVPGVDHELLFLMVKPLVVLRLQKLRTDALRAYAGVCAPWKTSSVLSCNHGPRRHEHLGLKMCGKCDAAYLVVI